MVVTRRPKTKEEKRRLKKENAEERRKYPNQTLAEKKAREKSEAKKEIPKKEDKPIILEAPEKKKLSVGEQIKKTASGVMDIVSAPLSKPKEFFTEGPIAGGEAVRDSREKIKEGDFGEAAKVIGTTVASTIVAAAATMGASYAANAVSKAAIVGKGSGVITKAGGVMRYATNLKSTALTKSFISKTFTFLKNPAGLMAVIGSYPFAGFIKEEALQTLSFSVKSARDSGNIEDEQRAIDEVNEILEPSGWEKLIAAVPFANVVKQLKDFYQAAATKNELDQNSLNKRISETGQESDFARERREGDEASEARELESMRFKSEYYALIREGKFEEAEELLAAQG